MQMRMIRNSIYNKKGIDLTQVNFRSKNRSKTVQKTELASHDKEGFPTPDLENQSTNLVKRQV